MSPPALSKGITQGLQHDRFPSPTHGEGSTIGDHSGSNPPPLAFQSRIQGLVISSASKATSAGGEFRPPPPAFQSSTQGLVTSSTSKATSASGEFRPPPPAFQSRIQKLATSSASKAASADGEFRPPPPAIQSRFDSLAASTAGLEEEAQRPSTTPQFNICTEKPMALPAVDIQDSGYPIDWLKDPEDEVFTGNWDTDMMCRRTLGMNYIWDHELKRKGFVLEGFETGKFFLGAKAVDDQLPDISTLEKRIKMSLKRRQRIIRRYQNRVQNTNAKRIPVLPQPRRFLRSVLKNDADYKMEKYRHRYFSQE
jgi:hypothetical protein